MWARWTFARVVAGVLLALAAGVVGLLVYMAAADRVLRVELGPRPDPAPAAAPEGLVIPVAGVRADELRDTFGAPRSGGRRHEGIDIEAPDGTPVLAAAAGTVVGLDSSALGGISLYQRALDQRTVFFYGHLQGFRAGLKAGDLVRAGEVVGFVGSTGNATTPHLHFSIHTVADPNRYWRGRTIPPCELLPCPEPAGGDGS